MEPISTVLALAQYAPQLIKWITGNDQAAQVASVAVDMAKTVTRAKDEAGAIQALQANPELVLKYQDAIESRALELDKAYLADLDSARKMQVAALQQDDVFSKRFIYYFAMAWSLFAMAFFIATTFATVPKDNVRVVDTILGFLLGTAIASIFNFLYGGTARSQKKDDLIRTLSQAAK